MEKILETALVSLMLMGFLIALLPQAAYAGMGSGPCSSGHTAADHKCNGYGVMIGHPEFNDHCDHTYGDISGDYPGAENCCADPGWLATMPPPTLGIPGFAVNGGNARTNTKSVSMKPRAISPHRHGLSF